jgi:pimeloyl-ACP methyl ester carboxylesterase
MERQKFLKIGMMMLIAAVIALSPTSTIGTSFFERANTQAICSDDNNTSSSPKSPNALPVILIHGYNEPPTVWTHWQHRLDADGIRYCTVSFSDDECGSALDHSHELSQIVQQVKSWTPHNQVNIVGHSKGGLDARQYLADTATNDVANLIMIGTPNGGDRLANEVLSTPGLTFDFYNLACRPALDDLEFGANDTQVPANPHTNYHTIAGNWSPSSGNFCTFYWPLSLTSDQLAKLGEVPNDGLVPISSVESAPNSTSLGHTSNCHTDLTLSDAEYTLSQDILRGGAS